MAWFAFLPRSTASQIFIRKRASKTPDLKKMARKSLSPNAWAEIFKNVDTAQKNEVFH